LRVPEGQATTATPGGPDDDPLARAREVVAFTRGAARRYNRARSSVRDLFIDVYSNTLALVCVLMMAASLVLALREEIAGRSARTETLADEHWQVLPADVLWMLLTSLSCLGIMLMARRLGPVTVSRPEGAWWLPLPVDRRPMVLRSLLHRLLAVGAATAVAYLPFSILTAVDRSSWGHAAAAATFGAVGIMAVAGAAVLQANPESRPARAAVVLGLVPATALPYLAEAVWPPVLAAAGASLLAAYVVSRSGEVPGVELERGGAVSGHAGASLFLLDISELRRALAGGPRAGSTGRGARFFARSVRGPFDALLRADIVAFLRLQPAPVVPLVWLGVCLAVVLITPSLPVLLQLAVILVAGCAASAGTGTVARRTAVVAELGALLPVAPALVQVSRMLMPAAAMAGWMGALSAALVALGTADPALVLVGAVAGVGMGAGAVRAATRPATDWTTPPVETPFGPVPRNQVSSLLRGTDMTVLAMVPVLLTLYLGVAHPWLMLAQCMASAIAVAVQAAQASVPS
jgi:hypothetical protein